ncbi:hypothetical protein AB3G45_19590 [Shinella sp. S4-D37]|uniref:hypothetical protein n=1 Tax=Shinella sp. S4-D37 TaxID=3161999 RepID=UPI003467E7FB
MVIDGVFGPWRPDLPVLDNPGVITARNVTPGIGNSAGAVTYYPLRRANLYSATTLSNRPIGTIVAQDKFKNAKVYAGDAGDLYKINPSDRSWVSIGRTGGYTTTEGERWNFADFGSLVIGTNFSDDPQYINKNDDIQFDALTTLTRGRHLAIVRDFLVIGNTYDGLDGEVPFRVRWSAFGNPFDWSFSQQTQADFQDIFNGGAVQHIVGGEAGWILLQNAIVKMTYIGAPLIFQFDEVVTGKGCAVPESVITVEGRTFFLSADGFYVLQGDQIAPIGAGKVDNHFLGTVDTSQYKYMTVASDPENTLVYWMYSSLESVDGVPDKMIIYNYQTGEWSEGDATVTYIFNSQTLPWTIEQLDIYGTIEEVPASFDSPIWSGGNAMLWGMDIDGNIYAFGGDNMRGIIETQEQFLSELIKRGSKEPIRGDVTLISGVRPLTHGEGEIQVRAGYRDSPNASTTYTSLKQINSQTGFAYFRHTGRFHRVRIALDGDWESAMGYQLEATVTGQR